MYLLIINFVSTLYLLIINCVSTLGIRTGVHVILVIHALVVLLAPVAVHVVEFFAVAIVVVLVSVLRCHLLKRKRTFNSFLKYLSDHSKQGASQGIVACATKPLQLSSH